MENSSRYFCNKECEYFPCHTGADRERFNCLFCYCPMNRFTNCPGKPEYIVLKDGRTVYSHLIRTIMIRSWNF